MNGTGLRRGAAATSGDIGGGDDKDNDATPSTTSGAPQTPAQTPNTGDVDLGDDDDDEAPIADRDKDGVADDVDCEPDNAAVAGTRLLQDDLLTDKGFFARADGFPASWVYNAGYVQGRLAASPDQAVFTKDPNVADAIVEVQAASTEIGNLATPNHRQMFITFATSMTNGVLSAVGCGVEVDGSQTVTQKTSIVRLNGSPGGITATPVVRVDREAVQVNEVFTMKGTFKANKVTCEVTVRGVTTTATATVAPVSGSIGFYTNQTKALFKQAKICKLK
ncbi:MAG: hypothetical protein KIT84_22995 [Labilithrix sp.]|nr:hypothetical protein [Labilithrix sp.]MCW5813913.1 hypothetical protein [Labilithrix sp.]